MLWLGSIVEGSNYHYLIQPSQFKSCTCEPATAMETSLCSSKTMRAMISEPVNQSRDRPAHVNYQGPEGFDPTLLIDRTCMVKSHTAAYFCSRICDLIAATEIT